MLPSALCFLLLLQSYIGIINAQEGCDMFIRNTNSQIIFSPNYPDDYDSYRTCNYVIERANSGICKVELQIIEFDLERDSSCSKDYFDLGEGYRQGLRSRRLCGNIASDTKKELFFGNRNTLTTRFQSDGSGSGRGFSIKVKQVPNSCLGGTSTTRSPTVCNHVLQGEFITLTSPNYPSTYPPNKNCQYKVLRLDSNICVLNVNINIFDLDGFTGQCFGDYLELPTGEKLCGRQSTTRIIDFNGRISPDNLVFRFHSNSVDQRSGFRIDISQQRNSCLNRRLTTPGPGTCRVEVSDLTGTITSPGYPYQYPTNVECVYTIKRYNSEVCKVKLKINSFSLESGFNCPDEYLRLPNGEKLCGRITGERMIDFSRSKDYMELTFKSTRHSSNNKGFQIEILQVPNSCDNINPNPNPSQCDQTISSQTAVITSPGFNSGRYGSNLRCAYTIRRNDRSTCIVDVNFNIRGIEDSFSCYKDYIRLPNGLNLCGYNKYVRKQLYFPSGSSNDIQLIFQSDSFGTGRGFEIVINQRRGSCSGSIFPTTSTTFPGVTIPGPSNCGGTYSTETFYLKSPGFQSNRYYNNQDCEFKLNKFSNNVCALEMMYNSFDLENSDNCEKDYLEVDGIKICGSVEKDSIRTYRFTQDTEVVKFHSDSFNTGKGFFIAGKQLEC